MDRSRRALLLGGTLTFLAPSRLYAQPDLGREHRPMIDSPTLAEDPSAVPLQVSVNHPMEPEHLEYTSWRLRGRMTESHNPAGT